MKQNFYILTFFLFSIQFVYGQNNAGIEKLYEKLLKSVDNEWISENPTFKPTESSFFNEENENRYFVGLLQISGFSIPFTWDNNLTLLHFLLTLDSNISVLTGIEADQVYKGTKIIWNAGFNGLIWFNDKSYKATVAHWHLFDFTECPGNIIFPYLSFDKIVDIPNALTNNIQGLTIIPYNEKLTIKSSATSMTMTTGKTVEGIAYDIDNDGIFDIFTYFEGVDEFTGYTRLYINVNGKWKCKWINLYEECI